MSDLTKNEPVLVTSAVTGVVAFILSQLVSHGVLTDTQATSATQTVTGFVALALPVLLGAVVRRFVTPVRKVAQVLEREGLLTDADWARLEAVIEANLGIDLDDTPTGGDHRDADLVGAPAGQSLLETPLAPPGAGGMSAGADTHQPEHAASEA